MPGNKKGTLKKLTVFGLIVFEIFVLLLMEVYKYYVNSITPGFISFDFLKEFLSRFNFFYTGNIFWFILFLLSIFSLYNIYNNLDRISNSAIRILVLISLILFGLLVYSLFLPGPEIFDSYTGNVIQLSTKGTKIVILSIFAVIKLFQTISLCVISFSALKKFYVFRSIWISILVFCAGFLIILISVYTYKDDTVKITNGSEKYDAGIVLGAAVWGGNRPSPVLKERINKGYDLYKEGFIKTIVLTGGGFPGEMTEAEVGKNELLKKGVDERNIFTENKSNSTLEQISYIYRNLYKVYDWKDIIIITDNFHLLRSKQICNFYGINTRTSASDTPLSSESTLNFSLKESFAIILFWLFGIG
jgi:vancomycin permeability regulator SanA